MICVYPADCTDFSTNGNGTLAPLSAEVTETLNGEYELTLVHLIDEAGKWQRLVEGCIFLLAATGAPLQPNTAQSCFLAVCQKQRSCPRLGQRLCAVSRGKGRAKRAAGSGDQPNYRSRVTGRATRHTEDAEAGGSLRQA